jgi:polysaccharide deacetylase 2 family uncharacterized protein YibQ
MSARRGAGGRIGSLIRFIWGLVVAGAAAVVAFVVYSGLTEVPDRPAPGVGEGAQAERSGPAAPQPSAGSLTAPTGATPAPAPRAAGGVAAPRPSGGSAPDTQAPVVAGTDSSGVSGVAGLSSPQPGGAPSLPSAPSLGAPAGLSAPSAPGGSDVGTGVSEGLPAVDPDATPEEKAEQLSALLGEAPASPSSPAPSAPGAVAPAAPEGGALPEVTSPDAVATPEEKADQLAALLGDAPAEPAGAEAEGTGETLAPQPEPEPEPERAPEPPAPVLALAGPAIEVNASDTSIGRSAAALAIVLSDAGEPGGLTPELLSGIPFPVTVGILAGTEGAADLAAAARAAGHEVLVQLPTEAVEGRVAEEQAILPGLAGDAAAARALTLLAGLPEGVAVSTWPASASQGAGGQALMAVLAEHGFGYLENRSFAGGVAEREAKEAGVVFAAADRTIQRRATPTQMAQQIGQTGNDAGRSGPQIVIMPATADALKAAIEWSLTSSGVRPVPLSAVMKARAD